MVARAWRPDGSRIVEAVRIDARSVGPVAHEARLRDGWAGDHGYDVPSTACAAVELGSNSFHLVVARILEATHCVQVVDRMRERIRLGLGVGRDGRIEEPLRTRALECLRRFGERIRGFDPAHVRAVGTHAIRRANDPEFLALARAALGFDIDVLDGVAEAELVHRGVSFLEPRARHERLVIDIGGGSTECIRDRGGSVVRATSVGVGCVSGTSRFFGDGRLQKRSFKRAVDWATAAFESARDAVGGPAASLEALGSSGTINAIQRIVLERNGDASHRVDRAALLDLRGALIEAAHVDAIAFRGIDAERRAVLPGGVAVLCGAFEAFGLESVRAVPVGLREGLVSELLDRIGAQAGVERHVLRQIGQRFHVDADHAERVASVAVALRAQLAPEWKLGGDAAFRVLFGAAWLHEVGLVLAHAGHHRHAEYLIRNTPLPGFRVPDRDSIAELVRYHRRKLAGACFTAHPDLAPKTLFRLCCVLRLAVVLHHARRADSGLVHDVVLRAEGSGRLALRLPWSRRTPMLERDLEQEAGWLRAVGVELDVTFAE